MNKKLPEWVLLVGAVISGGAGFSWFAIDLFPNSTYASLWELWLGVCLVFFPVGFLFLRAIHVWEEEAPLGDSVRFFALTLSVYAVALMVASQTETTFATRAWCARQAQYEARRIDRDLPADGGLAANLEACKDPAFRWGAYGGPVTSLFGRVRRTLSPPEPRPMDFGI